MDIMYNTFDDLPYVAYRIVTFLFGNENLWKLLKYDSYDCLSEPNLTEEEKISMIWTNQEEQMDCNVFLTPLILDSIEDSRTILKVFDYTITPENRVSSILCMRFEYINLGKSLMVDYNGFPCSKITAIKTELLKSLNGADVGGVGMLEFDTMLSRWCGSTLDLGNNKNAVGDSLTMAVRIATLSEQENGY